MDTNTTAAAPTPESDDAILARIEQDAQERAKVTATERKASDVAVARKLLEMRATSPEELFVIGDSGGNFRGIFVAPGSEVWKRWKSEIRSDQGRLIANQNLTNACMRWPGAADLAAAVTKRPALYDVIGVVLQERAGSGQDVLVKD